MDGMNAQLEKVRKGLQTAVDSDWMWQKADYIAMICKDALALINAQQERIKALEAGQTARVVTPEEIKDGESYWLSAAKEFTRPVICVHREDDARKSYITFVWRFGTFSWDPEDYGKTWRCWSAQPTDDQRKAVKWG